MNTPINFWNYFRPFTHPNPAENNPFILNSLTTLKVISYATIIIPLIMLVICIRSDVLANRVSLRVNQPQVNRVNQAAARAFPQPPGIPVARNTPPLLNQAAAPVVPQPPGISVARSTLTTLPNSAPVASPAATQASIKQMKDCTFELSMAFAFRENPEELFDDVNLQGKISQIKYLTPQDQTGLDSVTKSTLTRSKATVDFWTKYNSIVNSAGMCYLHVINQDNFFNKLAALSPDKTMTIIDKLEDESYNAAIQIVLPYQENFKDDKTKQKFLKLAADYCTLPEFLKPRVESILQMPVADFLAMLQRCNDKFDALEDPSKILSDSEVVKLTAIRNQLRMEDTSYSDEFEELCLKFETHLAVWPKYAEYQKGPMKVSEFTNFFQKNDSS